MANVRNDIRNLNKRSLEENIMYQTVNMLSHPLFKPFKFATNIFAGAAVEILTHIEKRWHSIKTDR